MELVPVHKADKSSGIAEECCDILNHEWPRSRLVFPKFMDIVIECYIVSLSDIFIEKITQHYISQVTEDEVRHELQRRTTCRLRTCSGLCRTLNVNEYSRVL